MWTPSNMAYAYYKKNSDLFIVVNRNDNAELVAREELKFHAESDKRIFKIPSNALVPLDITISIEEKKL